MPRRVLLARACHDGCGGQAGKGGAAERHR
jgi:hypothetical protein